MQWTTNQQKAIDVRNNNIIVSAGAGSGKTAVLKERVGKLIEEDNIDIDNLLVLTFTNAAAAEMKERIRNRLKESTNISAERKNELLNKIDSSQITTFDAYALFLVQKYHYLLNVKKDINIIDENILTIQKNAYIDDILQKYYKNNDQRLKSFIKNFTNYKSDNSLKNYIFKIDRFFEKYYDKEQMLKNYIDDFYNQSNYDKLFSIYEKNLLEDIKSIEDLFNIMKECFIDPTEFDKIYTNNIKHFLQSKTYSEIKNNLPQLKTLNKKYFADNESREKASKIKEKISKLIKNIGNKTSYSKQEIIDFLDSSKELAELIIEIEIELNKEINNYKKENNLYDFSDIFRMAINIIEQNKDICEEIKNNYKEILIDEYQDTNNLQEKFIQLIANNNVYCVGDIKQSIYRFRNAQPEIFQEKYQNYSDNKNGIAIDLLDNFRSRKEVVEAINMIFKPIMDLEIGGEDYKNHLMINGNKAYINTGEDYNLKVLCYDSKDPKVSSYTNREIEAFIIGQDIKNKIENKFKVCDKDYNSREVNYSDFCILMSTATEFDTYKNILTYLQIPVNIVESEKMTDSEIFTVFRSLFSLLVNITENRYDYQTKIDYLSICRSFIFKQEDEDNHDVIINNKLNDSQLINIIKKIANGIEDKTVNMILDEFINEFDIYDKLRYIKDTDANIAKINYIYQLAEQFTNAGNNYKDFNKYLDNIFNDDNKDIKFNMQRNTVDAVKIMTIHKSKGLQFKICYFPQLTKKFNKSDTTDMVICDKDYGISLPVLDEKHGIISTFNKEIIKNSINKKDIAEKIRLLYVALTRAEEQIILVYPEPTNTSNASPISNGTKLTWTSFYDMLSSNEALTKNNNVDLNAIHLSNDYKNTVNTIFNNINTNKENEIIIEDIPKIITEEIQENHFSKSVGLIDKDLKDTLKLGTDIHYYLELIDFHNPDLSFIKEKIYKDCITKFINSDLMKNINQAKIYKEYEFIYNENNQRKHGVIDLLLEYDDHFTIIDYKLKNIADEHYDQQLAGYKHYIESISSKKVECYLYSILSSEYRQITD